MLDVITTASQQWASRPADERFLSLPDLYAKVSDVRERSKARVLSNRRLLAQPGTNISELIVQTEDHAPAAPTHWAFGQLAALAGAPSGYLRKLPSDMAADCINYGLRHMRGVEEVGILQTDDELRAATGPNYGRVWNSEVVAALIDKFGDGVTGDWRVPGEFGKAVTVDINNTTIYGSDRDMFVFLADEENRIEIPDRRSGEAGSLARGFFVGNSEVGSQSLFGGFFLFDYVCMNRMIWGAREFQEIRIRHTSGAPDRWLEEIKPVLTQYASGSVQSTEQTLLAAKERKLDDVKTFLTARFSSSRAAQFMAAHEREEDGRPIETLFDAVTAITAFARGIEYQDERIDLERKGGALLDLVAA